MIYHEILLHVSLRFIINLSLVFHVHKTFEEGNIRIRDLAGVQKFHVSFENIKIFYQLHSPHL